MWPQPPGHISSAISLHLWVIATGFVSDQFQRRRSCFCLIVFLLFFPFFLWRKLAKKRKETLNSTRQEMTVMVNSMDKSYTEQGTNCDEALSFMDTHNHTLNTRSECALTLNGRSECTLTLNGRGKMTPRAGLPAFFSRREGEAIYLGWSGEKEIKVGCTGNNHSRTTHNQRQSW